MVWGPLLTQGTPLMHSIVQLGDLTFPPLLEEAIFSKVGVLPVAVYLQVGLGIGTLDPRREVFAMITLEMHGSTMSIKVLFPAAEAVQ